MPRLERRRRRARLLTPFRQAVFVPAWFCDGGDVERLGKGFGLSRATAYRYRDELFPTTIFRQAYDRLRSDGAKRADRDYVRILHLAASTSEAEVATALEIVLEAGTCPPFVTGRDLVQVPTMRQVPAIGVPVLDLSAYDQLIASRRDCV